jgi:hypothetical protein
VRRFAEIFFAQTLDHQREERTLNELAHAAGWSVLQPGESISLNDEADAIVISGVTWSKPDLDVLDELAVRDTGDTRVWFFNIDSVFPDGRILPGAPRVLETPVLAEYTGRRLSCFGQGSGVRARIQSRFPAR